VIKNIIHILKAEMTHQVQIPLIRKISVYVNQLVKQIPKIPIPKIIFNRIFLSESVRRKEITVMMEYPIKPNMGTGTPKI
jgi:hypothetical protein